MNVLFAASEALPFAASGGLADVAGALPGALCARGIDCRVVMPLYASIPPALREDMTLKAQLAVPVSWRRQYCGVYQAEHGGVTYYLLDNEYYFKRGSLYGEFDDGERFAFFSRAVLEILPHIGFRPDIIHCNDWQTAMTPVYRKAFFAAHPLYKDMGTVFTIHNVQYQGWYGPYILGDVFGLSASELPTLEWQGSLNLMKGALIVSDRVTTVSPSYAGELLDPWYAHGLDPVLGMVRGKLTGILNGIDTALYDPAADPDIPAHYSDKDLRGKTRCKRALQRELGLPETDAPVVGMVTRLVAHKGLDLVRDRIEEMLSWNAQFALLGSGDAEYERFFAELAARRPDSFALRTGFIPALARRIYAGSDIFLMPSRSEPCGLAQMVALRYGAVPVVRETGGLRDTVRDSGGGEGNGFTFANYDARDMAHAVRRALDGYANPAGWRVLMRRAMRCDNSWTASAGVYAELYGSMV